MSALFNQVIFEWLDENNMPAVTFWGTIDQTPGNAGNYSALATATQALSDAALTHITFQQVLSRVGSASDGPYKSAIDRAAFLVRMVGTRQSAQFQVPAPKEEILTPNHELVDMSNPLVLDWQAAMEAAVASSSGQEIGQWVRGWRTRARGDT